MIDLLLKLLENLQKLAEYRSAHKRRSFKELAEPMFNELLDVHKNYILLFAEARSLARKNPKDPSPAIDYLEMQRITFQPVRVKLSALASTLRKPEKSSLMYDFLLAVARYFPVGDILEKPRPHRTASTSLIEKLKRLPPSYQSTPAEVIGTFIDLQEQKWNDVCKAFASMKEADLEAL